nr:glycine-rich RNA-binding protein RZ1C isoform X2 [Ipomoea trifida]
MMGICNTVHPSIQVMLERDTHRPRGFGFLTFGDRRAMDDAIREMHGRELGGRTISVNKAQPRMGGDGIDHGGYGEVYSSGGRDSYGRGYSSGGRDGGYGGPDRSAGQDNCFRCGRPGHWARDCPLEGGGRGGRPMTPPPRSRFGGAGARGDRFGSDRDRYLDDRYDRGHYADRDRIDSRDDRYGSRDRYVSDRYPPSGDRFAGNRYGGPDRFPQNGYGKERGGGYGRDGGGPRVGGGDRYGAGVGGPSRYEGGRSYRDRAGPYDRPRRGGHSPSFDRY